MSESAPIAGNAAPDAISPIRQYLRIAMRWRWVIIGATGLCILLGLIVTLLMTPQYTASTTIEIAREADQVTKFEGVEREVSTGDQEFYQTQYGLLVARTLAERVALQLRLVDDPAFFEAFGAPDGEAFDLSSGNYPASGRAIRQRAAGDILLDNVSIEPTRLSRLVEIKFTAPDPTLAARVVNAWSQGFIESNLERKIQATSYGREQLQRQLAEYKQRIDDSQRQLVAYASAQGIINIPTGGDGEERSLVVNDLATLSAALSQAAAERIAAQASYREAIRAGANTEALGNLAINNLRQRRAELEAEYERMMVRFEPGYPMAAATAAEIAELDRAITREENRVSTSLQTEYREARARENDLRARVEELKNDYIDVRRRSIQYNIYQQEVDTNRALYDGLLQRFKEIGVAGGVGVNNVAIIDPANIPQSPSSPRLLLNMLIATLAGLGIGAGLAYLLEQMDETITDPAEVEQRLGLPLLGTVPKSEEEMPAEALADPKSDLFEAYLAVQTNLGFTTEHGVPRSFAITSTRPAEGKSTTALALATTLTRAGRKVILVDGDMRSPSVHHLIGTGHDKGLSNFLAGEDDLSGLIAPVGTLGVSAMTAGPIPPNAAELLTGNRLSVLIEQLLEHYDHVVIDSPPVMGLADAPLIASRVEGVIYAVESHGIRSTLVKAALARLASAHAHVFGGVLTKFEARKARYGYDYAYGYGYGRKDLKDA